VAQRWHSYARTARTLADVDAESAYRRLSDPANISRFEPLIERLEAVEPPARERRTTSHWRTLGVRWASTYHFVYRPPHGWRGSGDGRLVRGLFVVAIVPRDGAVQLLHTEAVQARWRWLAVMAGWLWFTFLRLCESPLGRQVDAMRELAEDSQVDARPTGDRR
jgi:hypothetical protein